jgi:hypothetical protein
MADSSARATVRAIAPPPDSSDSDGSGARLTSPRSAAQPASAAHPVEADWTSLATAPTLLLTPINAADENDAAIASGTATAPPAALEDQPWFKTGATVAPPSMQPAGETLAPPPVRNPPNPRVLKLVSAVIAACLLIVALAGLKVLYKKLQSPAPAQMRDEKSMVRTTAATADLAPATPSASEHSARAELPRPAPEPTAQGTTATPAARSDPRRSAPARTTPPRPSTKTTTHRAPAPKKATHGSR